MNLPEAFRQAKPDWQPNFTSAQEDNEGMSRISFRTRTQPPPRAGRFRRRLRPQAGTRRERQPNRLSAGRHERQLDVCAKYSAAHLESDTIAQAVDAAANRLYAIRPLSASGGRQHGRVVAQSGSLSAT